MIKHCERRAETNGRGRDKSFVGLLNHIVERSARSL